jgi:acetyl-CoA C-acetyltransferase
MNEVYIVEAKRTAIGSFGGSLKDLSAVELAVPVIKNVMENTGLEESQVDEVILGNVFKAGGKGNPARQATIHANLSVETPAMTIDKQCASGLRAITIGALEIEQGNSDIIIAGGTESMSNVPYLLLDSRWGKKMGDMKAVDGLLYDGLNCAIENYHMGVTAENIVEKYNISRREQDEYALKSQRKALAALESGKFMDEIVPLKIKSKKEEVMFEQDEYPRNTRLDKLSKLPAAFIRDGSVTAGNASGLNDGAAIVLLASKKAVAKHQLKPLGKIISFASAAVQPSVMGIGPVPATKKALAKAGMSIDKIDLAEINEAFAAQVLAVNKELGINESNINVNGGAIALGHPVGCSGARIVVTLLHELKRKNKSCGLATLCVGGGQGVSIIVESL